MAQPNLPPSTPFYVPISHPPAHFHDVNGDSRIKFADLPQQSTWTVSEILKTIRNAYEFPSPSGTVQISELWFRGESKDFELSRLLPNAFRKKQGDEKRAYDTYRHMYHKDILPNTDPLLILSDMQHYGLPTRLLDWSSSLLVAIYFACCNHPSEDGYLYTFDPAFQTSLYIGAPLDVLTGMHMGTPLYKENVQPRLQWIEPEWSTDPEAPYGHNTDPIAVRVPRNNPRIQAQMGLFTLHGGNPHDDHPNFLPDNLRPGLHGTEVIVIPSAQKASLLEELKFYGINEMTLFPDDKSKMIY